MGPTLKVEVCLYKPAAEEIIWYEWTSESGDMHKEDMPPYCLKSRAETASRLCHYTKKSSLAYLAELLDGADRIVWDTFNIALRSHVW